MAVSKVEAVIDGKTYTLSAGSETGLYEAAITAPSRTSYMLIIFLIGRSCFQNNYQGAG